MKSPYIDIISLVERLHRQCLEIIKAELDRLGIRDLSNVQALILSNIGQEELTVGELTQRGCYLGSTVSYNVKTMVENAYLIQERSPHDRRSFHVRASAKGLEIYRRLDQLFGAHCEKLDAAQVTPENLEQSDITLRCLEQFWATPQHFTYRVAAHAATISPRCGFTTSNGKPLGPTVDNPTAPGR